MKTHTVQINGGKNAIPLSRGDGTVRWCLHGRKPGNMDFLTGDAADALAAFEALERTPEQLREILNCIGDIQDLEGLKKLVAAWKAKAAVVLPYPIGTYVKMDGRLAYLSEFFGYEKERYYRVVFVDNHESIAIGLNDVGSPAIPVVCDHTDCACFRACPKIRPESCPCGS